MHDICQYQPYKYINETLPLEGKNLSFGITNVRL